MKDLFTDKQFSNIRSCSNVKKRKVTVILYLKIWSNNDTVKLTLFSTVESNVIKTLYKWQKE